MDPHPYGPPCMDCGCELEWMGHQVKLLLVVPANAHELIAAHSRGSVLIADNGYVRLAFAPLLLRTHAHTHARTHTRTHTHTHTHTHMRLTTWVPGTVVLALCGEAV
jgi:hypothetical protein